MLFGDVRLDFDESAVCEYVHVLRSFSAISWCFWVIVAAISISCSSAIRRTRQK